MLSRIPAGEPVDRAQYPWGDDAAVAVVSDPIDRFLEAAERDAWAQVDPMSADTVICHCLQVDLATLEQCIQRGCASQEELARETGVTTVCGGCTAVVAELVGGVSGYPARLTEVGEILPSVRSFRFAPLKPCQGPIVQPKPGQHVVVSALIDGSWVSRPYTLTSAGAGGVREITVELQPNGRLSTWLFEQGPGDSDAVRITDSQGHFHVDIDRPEPIIFFAAGIGITPAIAIARSLAEAGTGTPLFLDYSERGAGDFAFREELERLTRSTDGIGVRFRLTGAGQRLRRSVVEAYAQQLPDARYCICGPESYQKAVRKYLTAAGVDDSRIQIEVFNPASAGRVVARPAQVGFWGSRARVLGLTLLTLYLAQGAFGWSWPWLEGLQDQEHYRRWSGAALLGLIAIQWGLPLLRLADRFRAAARAYRWHRRLGALAPLLFYAHATWPGFGYLLALGWVYLANVLVGLSDKTILRDVEGRERYARVWLAAHVGLALLTVGLSIFHVYVVLAYK